MILSISGGRFSVLPKNNSEFPDKIFMNFDEEQFKKTIQPYFATARAGDWEHALRVVKWVKELGASRSDLDLLVTAACIHDIGWSGIAPAGKLNFDEMRKLEPQANRNSSILISRVLSQLHFSDSEIQTVNRLVAAADNHQSVLEDEAVIVDADTLSKLCIEHLQEKYQPASYFKLIDLCKYELVYQMKTPKGKEIFPQLLADLEKIVARGQKKI